jgi:hypothetical protein
MGLNGELWNRPFKLVLSQICSIDKRHFLELFVQGAQQISHCFDRTNSKKYLRYVGSCAICFCDDSSLQDTSV